MRAIGASNISCLDRACRVKRQSVSFLLVNGIIHVMKLLILNALIFEPGIIDGVKV